MTIDPDKIYTEDEASEALRLATSTLQKQRHFGTGAAFLRMGGSVRYKGSDLLAYAANCRRTSTSQRAA